MGIRMFQGGEDRYGTLESTSIPVPTAPTQFATTMSQNISRLKTHFSAGGNTAYTPKARTPWGAYREPHLLAVIIQEVMPEERCLSTTAVKSRNATWREELKHQNIFFHKSYVGAALELRRFVPELISVNALAKIAHDAIDEFNRMRSFYVDFPNWEEAHTA